MGEVLVIAHRGASAYEPENTLRSVKKAIELGADMVEVDVRASKDGFIVVVHDEKVDRTTNGKGFVQDMTLHELKLLDAGHGESIPTLQEVIQLVKGKANLVIELKTCGTEKRVVNIVKEMEFEKNVLITSFHHTILRKVKDSNQGIKTGIIISCRPVKPAQLALDARADAIFPKHIYADQSMVEEAHESGLMIFPWPIDSPEITRKLVKLEVDGIVTNKPDIVKRFVR